jgi:hypothetical protein
MARPFDLKLDGNSYSVALANVSLQYHKGEHQDERVSDEKRRKRTSIFSPVFVLDNHFEPDPRPYIGVETGGEQKGIRHEF